MVKIATWNINSVRLRIGLVRDFLIAHEPDVLCLQETKCRDGDFPAAEFHALGYHYLAIHGQKGYHGVAIASKYPINDIHSRQLCTIADARYIGVSFDKAIFGNRPLTVHNFYVPAGGDEPDPEINPKFAHKLAFLTEMADWFKNEGVGAEQAVLVGDLNIAPLESDVWNHKALLKVVSHTPIEVEKLKMVQNSADWIDALREKIHADQKLYTWWSYRSPDWQGADRGRRLDHIWVSPQLHRHIGEIKVLKEARSWERPSDHVPVMMTLLS